MVMKNRKIMKCLAISRSSHQIYSVEKAVLKNFANVTGKHLRWSLFLMKSYAFRPATLLKRDYKIDLFLVKFPKYLRTPISKNICERLLCISYDLHKYVNHVKKNCQRTCAKFMNYLQRFHIIAFWKIHQKIISVIPEGQELLWNCWKKQSEPLANIFVDLFTIFWVSFILLLFRWKGIRPGGC